MLRTLQLASCGSDSQLKHAAYTTRVMPACYASTHPTPVPQSLLHDLCRLVFAARDAAGKLCGIVVLAVLPTTAEAFLAQLIAGFADHDVKKHKFEMQDGYLAATGYVLAQAMTGTPAPHLPSPPS